MIRAGIIGYGRLGRALYSALKCDKRLFISVCEKKRISDKSVNKVNMKEVCESDYIFVCVNDDSTLGVIKKMRECKKNIVFLSASFEMKTANKHLKRAESISIFHPIQSFSNSNTSVNQFKSIYATLECRGENNLIRDFSKKNKIKIIEVGEDIDRRLYHLCAMLAGNYSLAMLIIAANQIKKALKRDDIGYEIFMPMIEGIVEKTKNEKPENILTGPSSRNDIKSVKKIEKGLKNRDLANLLRILDAQTRRALKDE